MNTMINQYPIIDLRHQIDWRRRVLSEACTLSLWIGFGLLLSQLWRPPHINFLRVVMDGAAAPIGRFVSHNHALHLSEAGLGSGHYHAVYVPLIDKHWVVAHAAHHTSAHTTAFSGMGHGVLSFAAIILAAAAFLLLWKLGSAIGARRAPSQAVHKLHSVKLCATTLHTARGAQVCTVHHDEDGQIVAISHHPATPVESLKDFVRAAQDLQAHTITKAA